MLQNLRCFECHPLSDYKSHPTANAIRLDPVQIAIPIDLHLLCRLAVDAYRAVRCDQPDLVVGRHVLQVCGSPVCGDLLHVPLDLLLPRNVPIDPKLPPHVIGNKDRESLRGSACAPDRPCVEYADEFGAVIVLCNCDPRDPLDRGCDDTFGEKRNSGSYRGFHSVVPALEVVDAHRCYVGSKLERGLLPAHAAPGKFAYPARNRNLDQVLNPVSNVLCHRDFGMRLRVSAARTRS